MRTIDDPWRAPSGATAYVTTASGLWVFETATEHVTAVIRGLGRGHNAATNRVTGTIGVGQLPWQLVLAPKRGTLYVADALSGDGYEGRGISA